MSNNHIECECCKATEDKLEIRPLLIGRFVSYYTVECTSCKHIFDIKVIN
jgi:hypothetical protein